MLVSPRVKYIPPVIKHGCEALHLLSPVNSTSASAESTSSWDSQLIRFPLPRFSSWRLPQPYVEFWMPQASCKHLAQVYDGVCRRPSPKKSKPNMSLITSGDAVGDVNCQTLGDEFFGFVSFRVTNSLGGVSSLDWFKMFRGKSTGNSCHLLFMM